MQQVWKKTEELCEEWNMYVDNYIVWKYSNVFSIA